MIVLCFSMQVEVTIVHTNVKCHAYNIVCKRRILLESVMCLHFSMQGDHNIEHTIVRCHVFTLLVNLLIIVDFIILLNVLMPRY